MSERDERADRDRRLTGDPDDPPTTADLVTAERYRDYARQLRRGAEVGQLRPAA